MDARWLALAAACVLVACDRNMEPYVPGEEPQQPDLSRIFPAGAEPEVQREVGLPAPREQAEARGAPAAVASGPPIQGVVSLAPELEGRATPGAVLFLIARPGAAGPPLAVKRIAAPEFPLRFSLGPQDRMLEAMPFAGPLLLSARLDADGNASTRSPGDLQGAAPEPVNPGARGVSLVLDEVL